MYCKKCGSEVAPNEKFCGKCGAPVEPAAQPAAHAQQPTARAQGGHTVTLTIPKQLRSPFGILYAVAAFLHLLQLIFWNISTISVAGETMFSTAFVLKLGAIMRLSGASDAHSYSFATVFFIILTTVSILLCVAPLFQNTFNKPRKMIVPLISCVWTFIWMIVALNIGESGVLSASFFGWLFIIFTVLTILVEVGIVLLSNKVVALSAVKN